ncbi:MAG: ABC transporter substrate-binding protein [Desulfobacteraceae bacterium]|nr:MAG: ABC transporter substrate-binding protein [Desulfobacteraceae bacterium]
MKAINFRNAGLLIPPVIVLCLSVVGWGVRTAECKTRVVVAQGVEPTVLDPDMHRENSTNNVILHIYDALLERDSNEKIQPDLAESWKIIDDKTLEFKLRKGIAFSNGEPFDAKVVKYNYERVAGLLPGAKKTKNSRDFKSIGEVQIIDENTVRLVTKYPDPLLLSYACTKYMVPIEYTKKDNFEKLATKPVGTGPYLLESWMKGGELVLVAKKDYWKGTPKIDEVVFRPIPEDATRIAELQVGSVDIVANLKPDNVSEVQENQDLEVKFVPSVRVAAVWINALMDKLKDSRVRKAVNYAIDVKSLIENVMGGNGYRVSTVAPNSFIGWDPEEQFYPYDPQKAKQLLKEAGYPDGFEATILTPRGRYLNDVQACEAIAGMLTKVGIKTRVEAVEFGVFAKKTQAHEMPEFMYAAWGNSQFDVWDMINTCVRSGAMFSWYKNDKVDEYIDQAARTIDPQKHSQYLQMALREMWADPPFAFLYQQRDIYGVNKRLVWEPRSDEDINLSGAYLKK